MNILEIYIGTFNNIYVKKLEKVALLRFGTIAKASVYAHVIMRFEKDLEKSRLTAVSYISVE